MLNRGSTRGGGGVLSRQPFDGVGHCRGKHKRLAILEALISILSILAGYG